MRTICLDFETVYKKSEYSVRELGNWKYTHDDRFDPYLLSVFDGSEGWVGNPADFNWDALAGSTLLAHNAAFERAICARLAELGRAPRLDNPWQCTANLTSFLASTRSLDKALRVLEGKPISKSIRDWMSGKTWADAVDAGKADELAQYALDDAKECWGLWDKYGHRWPQFERDLSELTMRQCARGVAINTDLLTEYRMILQEVIWHLERSLPWTERGAAPTSPIAVAEQCKEAGIPAPPVKTHDEEGFDKWLATYGPQYSWVYGVGNWRQLGKLLASLDTIQERLRPDGTIDFSLLYFGGHTGRWSGGGSGLNMQNLRKVPLFLKNRQLVAPPTGLGKKAFADWQSASTDYALDVRKLFVPRAGKKFILCDLSQIEPRCLAWLTGNSELLQMLGSGMAIYEAFARVSMGWTGGELSTENADLYQLAKIQVLGLGYGCGWEKFITIAAGYGVALDEPKSRELVEKFRENNPKITALWRSLDDAFRESVNDHFVLTLPSGRSLTYRNVLREVRSKKNRTTGKWEPRFVFTAEVGDKRVETYGGKLTENLVQAVARDVFGGHLLELEKSIGDVIWHVHDEAITEVDCNVKPSDVEQVMSVCPDWLEGCPVGAKAKEAPHYLKG
jgi:hypothetical protein